MNGDRGAVAIISVWALTQTLYIRCGSLAKR